MLHSYHYSQTPTKIYHYKYSKNRHYNKIKWACKFILYKHETQHYNLIDYNKILEHI